RTSQLTIDECNNLIGCLQAELDGAQNLQKTLAKADADRRNGLRRKLIAVVYSLPEKLGFYETKNNKKHFSGSVFDDFLMNNPRSPFVGRKLNELGVNELTKLMAIMKKWVDFYNKKA
ncbi:MAG: hypothetical protein JW735_09010, partial [Prolixibacteraceae bacterium]|nr:hypothetical protein [Prolixibacteraceae bacterium]